MIAQLLGLLALVGFIALVFLGVGAWSRRRGRGAARRRHGRCDDCRHRLRGFDDGVLCGAHGARIFKNPAHIANCPHREPGARDPTGGGGLPTPLRAVSAPPLRP